MKLKDYIFYLSLEGSAQERENKLMEYLGLSYDKNSLDSITKKINKIFNTDLSTYKKIFKWFYIKGHGIWSVRNDIRKESAAQFILYDSYLIDSGTTLSNLHNILSIYIRPVKWYGVEKWIESNHEKNANILLNSDMKYIYPLINFFFLNATNYILNTNIIYLNQETKEIHQEMQEK